MKPSTEIPMTIKTKNSKDVKLTIVPNVTPTSKPVMYVMSDTPFSNSTKEIPTPQKSLTSAKDVISSNSAKNVEKKTTYLPKVSEDNVLNVTTPNLIYKMVFAKEKELTVSYGNKPEEFVPYVVVDIDLKMDGVKLVLMSTEDLVTAPVLVT